MTWLDAPEYTITRALIERLLALVYVLAFVNVIHQFPALLGERGLLPTPRFLRATTYRDAPSLFHWRYSDRLVIAVGVVGVIVAAALLVGLPQSLGLLPTIAAWLVLWALYLSIVNVGQTFYSFGWESLLLEAGFLAIFLGDDRTAPPALVLLLFRWLAFRVEFGAGLIKLRGDPCWRDLTCMDYHHETQPMPNPLSWYAHRAPRRWHRLEVAGNFGAQLVAPVCLFLPQPIAGLAALVMIGTQSYLVVTGNYAWLNLVTMITALAAIPDSFFGVLVPVGQPAYAATPIWFVAAVALLTVFVVVLSYWPVRNLLGRRQLMNFSFNRYHLVNTYGAFGTVSRDRFEVIIEGSQAQDPDESDWREYEFIGKPGDPMRRPPQIAPYHLRLDWLLWFLPLSPSYGQGWFVALVEQLLVGDRQIRRLIRHDPFDGAAPRFVRARLFLYRLTTREERRETGAWWSREPAGEYFPSVALREP